ncbi:MAG: hypothetical protein ABIU95_02875 [Burkholderiales bacterium]
MKPADRTLCTLARRGIAAVVIAALTSACAGTPPRTPLTRIAMLPVVPQAVVGAPVRPSNSVGVSVFGGGDVSAVGAAVVMAVAGLGILFGHEADKRQAELDRTVAALGFEPVGHINDKLKRALESRGVVVSEISDAEAAMVARRSRDFQRVADGADAILDVRVGDNGFYQASGSGGYSPMLGVVASLRGPIGRVELDGFGYYADWRTNERDPRWVTSPPALTYPTLDAMLANADAARAGLEALADRIVEMLAEDVKRRFDAAPRLQ